MSEPLENLRDAILGMDEATALKTTEELLSAEVEPQEILETGMTAAPIRKEWNRRFPSQAIRGGKAGAGLVRISVKRAQNWIDSKIS